MKGIFFSVGISLEVSPQVFFFSELTHTPHPLKSQMVSP